MNNNFIPTEGTESWKKLLVDASIQWQKGFSAKTLANCWEDNPNLPIEIDNAFLNINIKLNKLIAIPEYKVFLDTKKAPSQNDIFVLARDVKELYTIMIEGKVSEPFDKTISEWNNTKGKSNRINFLCNKLEIKNLNISNLRYQLFHRTVSAILTAEKFHSKKAVMLIHSFSKTNEWFDDYKAFVNRIAIDHRLKTTVSLGNIISGIRLSSGIELFFGWIKGNNKYLKY